MEIIRNEQGFNVNSTLTNKDQSKVLRTAIVAALFVALGLVSACGGSGGGSSASVPESESVPTVPEPELELELELEPEPDVANSAPLADAGADQGVTEQEPVTLSGVGSSDSDGSIKGYLWSQSGGTRVELSDETHASPTFNAPETYANESLSFKLTVADDDGATAEDTVVVNIADIPSPAIVMVQPKDLTVDAERSGDIVVQFSEAILPSSIDNSRFTLQGPLGVVAASVSVDEDGVTATLTPDKKLGLLTPYTAVLSGEISGEQNNKLGVDVSWGFATTEDRNWEEPELLEYDDVGGASQVQIEFDSAGNAIAVWRQNDGVQYNIWASRFTVVDSRWSGPIKVDSQILERARDPQIAFDVSGSALVVWTQDNGVNDRIWSSRYDVSIDWGAEAWSGAVAVDLGALGDAGFPEVAFYDDGKAWVVWEQTNNGLTNILGGRYTFSGGTWEPAELLETEDEGDAAYVHLAFDGNGDGFAVWHQDDGELFRIRVSRFSSEDGMWGDPEVIDLDNKSDAKWPEITLDNKGNAVLVWFQEDDISESIWAKYYSEADGWLGTEIIINADMLRHSRIAIDGDGNAMVAWVQDGTSIGANYYVADDGWGGVYLFGVDANGAPDVAFDGGGNAFVVWRQGGNLEEDVWVNRYISNTADAGWQVNAAPLEEDSDRSSAPPKLAVDSEGNALVVWEEAPDNFRANIKAARFD